MKSTPILLQIRIQIVIVFLSLLMSVSGYASHIMHVKYVYGDINCQKSHSGETRSLSRNDTVGQGEILTTKEKCWCDLACKDGSNCRIFPDSNITISKLEQNSYGTLNYNLQYEAFLHEGQYYFEVNKLNDDSTYVINTPVGKAVVRGTRAIVSYLSSTENGTFTMRVTVIRGLVDLQSQFGVISESVASRQTAILTGSFNSMGDAIISNVEVRSATAAELNINPENSLLSASAFTFTPSTQNDSTIISPSS